MRGVVFSFISIIPFLFLSCNRLSEKELTYQDSIASLTFKDPNIEGYLVKLSDVWYMEHTNAEGHIIRRRYNPTQEEISAYEAENIEEEEEQEEEFEEEDNVVDWKALNHRMRGWYNVTEIHDTNKYKLFRAAIIFNPFIIKFDEILFHIDKDDSGNPVEWHGDTPVWMDGYKVEKLNDDIYHLRYLSEEEENAIVDSITDKNPDFIFLADHDDNKYGLAPFFGKDVNVRMDTTFMPDSLFLYYEEETIRLDRIEY